MGYIYKCFWEKEIDKEKICVHVKSRHCGKKCNVDLSEMEEKTKTLKCGRYKKSNK